MFSTKSNNKLSPKMTNKENKITVQPINRYIYTEEEK